MWKMLGEAIKIIDWKQGTFLSVSDPREKEKEANKEYKENTLSKIVINEKKAFVEWRHFWMWEQGGNILECYNKEKIKNFKRDRKE